MQYAYFLLHSLLFPMTQSWVGGFGRGPGKIGNYAHVTGKDILLNISCCRYFWEPKKETGWHEVDDGGHWRWQMFLLDEISYAQYSKIFVRMAIAKMKGAHSLWYLKSFMTYSV